MVINALGVCRQETRHTPGPHIHACTRPTDGQRYVLEPPLRLRLGGPHTSVSPILRIGFAGNRGAGFRHISANSSLLPSPSLDFRRAIHRLCDLRHLARHGIMAYVLWRHVHMLHHTQRRAAILGSLGSWAVGDVKDRFKGAVLHHNRKRRLRHCHLDGQEANGST